MVRILSEVYLNSLERCKPLLGTFVDVSLSGNINDNALISLSNSVFQEIERIQNIMSFHDPLSELSLLNKAMLTNVNELHEISTDLYHVLSLALELHACSDGYYDIAVAPQLVMNKLLPDHLTLETYLEKNKFTLAFLGTCNHITLHEKQSNSTNKTLKYLLNTKPLCLDLGGIAKGYAVDCAIKKIPPTVKYTINAGGDMAISHWQSELIAVKYAKRTQAVKDIIMQNKAVASSGLYHQESSSHIINPKKSKNSAHKFSGVVTVFASTTVLADALTKIVILMTQNKAEGILQHFQANAIIVNRFGFKRSINN